jgi:hypothetical protein
VNGAGGRSFRPLLKDKPGDFAKLADQYMLHGNRTRERKYRQDKDVGFRYHAQSTVAPKSDQVRELIINV